MVHSDAAVGANTSVPRAVRTAGTCFLVVSSVLVVYLILKAMLDTLSWRDLRPGIGVLVSLYLWWALRAGEREARTTGLVFGILTIVLSGAFLVYGVLQLPALDAPREAVILLVDTLFLGPAAAFVAACVAVVLLQRPESKAFFRSANSA